MRILIVIWSIQIGGAETFAIELCRYLKNRGYKPYLFPVLGPWDREYYDFIRSSGVSVLSIYQNRLIDWLLWKVNAFSFLLGKGEFRNIVTKFYFKKILQSQKIQLIISNSLIADNFVGKNIKDKIPYIVVEHGQYSSAAIDNYEIDSYGLLHANEVVCVSNWCRQILNQKWNISPTVIYNGHSQKQASGYPNLIESEKDEFIFCMLGRGIESKGWEEAIKAFLIVKKHFGKSRLILIGDGEFLQKMKILHGKETGISFMGKLTEPEKIIKYIHVGLVPSRKYEAFGITILDFFSFGKPVLASHIGAIPEVINYENKLGGVLIPIDKNKHINIDLLANKMMELIDDPNLYSKMSNYATEIYNSFSFLKTGKEYERLINKYLK